MKLPVQTMPMRRMGSTYRAGRVAPSATWAVDSTAQWLIANNVCGPGMKTCATDAIGPGGFPGAWWDCCPDDPNYECATNNGRPYCSYGAGVVLRNVGLPQELVEQIRQY